MILMFARLIGVIFSFLIPMFLGRHLSIEEYGTYKQVMLIYWFAQITLNLGFDDAAYYYYRLSKDKLALYGFNSLILNLVITGGIAAMLVLFREQLARLLNNPALVEYVFPVSSLIVLTLCSLQFEGFLLNTNQVKKRFALDISTELSKAVGILVGYVFYNSLHVVLLLLNMIMMLRFFGAVHLIYQHHRAAGFKLWEARLYLGAQFRYGLPLGASRIVHNLLNLETFLVSSVFNLRQFTFYSVGSFENPLINTARGALYEVVNIDLVENIKGGFGRPTLTVWIAMLEKLFMISIPMTVYMIFFSQEVMVFIFSEKFQDSAGYFRVFNLFILFSCLNPEPLFRATQSTGALFKVRLIGGVLGVGLLLAAAFHGEPLEVLWTKVFITGTLNLVGLYVMARLIKISFADIVPTKFIFRILVLSVVIGGFSKAAFDLMALPLFFKLSLSFLVFCLCYVYSLIVFRHISIDDLKQLGNFKVRKKHE